MAWHYLLMWVIVLEICFCVFSDSVVKRCYLTLGLYAGFSRVVRREVNDWHTRLIHRKIFVSQISIIELNNKVADNILLWTFNYQASIPLSFHKSVAELINASLHFLSSCQGRRDMIDRTEQRQSSCIFQCKPWVLFHDEKNFLSLCISKWEIAGCAVDWAALIKIPGEHFFFS